MPTQVLDLIAAAARGRLTKAAGYDQGSGFRTALLNGFGQFFIVLLVVAGYQVYVLLESFLRPLAWALLTGTILFPFKTFLSTTCKSWIKQVKESNKPFAFALVRTPFSMADFALDWSGDIVVQIFREHTTAILWGLFAFAIISVSQNFMSIFLAEFNLVGALYRTAKIFVAVAASNWIWLIVIAYVTVIFFFWDQSRYKERIYSMAFPINIAVTIHLIATFGALAFPVVIFSTIILGIGFVGELKILITSIKAGYNQKEIEAKVAAWGRFSVFSPWNFTWWPALVRSTEHIASAQLMVAEQEVKPVEEEESDDEDDELGSEANRYLKFLFKFFFIVQLWENYQILPLLVFPTIYSFLKTEVPKTRPYIWITNKIASLFGRVKDMIGDRTRAIIPTPTVGLYRMALYGDRRILHILESSIDETASNIMIFLMFMAVLIGSFVVALFVHKETSYMIRMSGEFVNRTMSAHPEYLSTWLPEGTQLQDQLQTGMDSMYTYARQFVGDTVRSAVGDENITNTEHITTEVLTVMDKIYVAFVANNATNETDALAMVQDIAQPETMGVFSTSFFFDMVYQNFETVYSVFNSVASVITDNLALIASMATSFLSFFITYFSQFLDFILNAVFFLASLSFLLSLSGEDRYYPLEKLSMLADYFPEAGNVATIVEQTISGIFSASLKMATFYGVYTYTLLSIFDVYVRFIPSVIAGIFAVIPIFPTFIVVVPALLEVLFVREDYFLAGLLAIGSYIPSTFVDEVMYKEVKTAHPYMFGLSVAGGLMTMGIEGVVVGPILLCAFVIAIELSKMILKPAEDKKT